MFALDILNQYQSENGNVLAAGKLFIYKQGRTELAEIYSDINGSVELANPVILNNLGMTDTPVYLSRLYSYTVVCKNMYGEELFSRDIYPNIDSDAGPAISGYLYEGISPIVVNNVDKAISAINVPIGVQEPLYFVEDSSAACIIGIDSDAMVSGYVTSGDLATVSADITAMIPTALTGDYLDKASADTLYYPLNTNPSGYLVEDDITGKQDVSAMTAYAQNSALTAQLALSGGNGISLVEDYINDVLLINVTADGGDTAVNSLVHANSAAWNEVSAKQPSGNYYSASNPSGFISEVPDTYLQNSDLGITDNKITAISGILLSAGDELPESVSAATDCVTANSATWNSVTNKLDTTAFSDVSGNFLTALPSDLVYTADITGKLDTSVYATDSAMFSGAIDYVSANIGDPVSSPLGTILVNGSEIEATNSAVATATVEGFVKDLGYAEIGPIATARFSWDKSLPNTVFTFTVHWPNSNTIVTYSADTNLTGEIIAPGHTATKLDISVPNATALSIWGDDWFLMTGCSASAADSIGMTVGELAWASALPTYEYDSSDKISAINGSAIAVGGPYQPSGNYIPYTATESSLTAFETNSGLLIRHTILGGLNSTYIGDNVQVHYVNGGPQNLKGAVLSYNKLSFETNSGTAYADKEKIDKWDSASDYIQNNSATINNVNTSYQTNSGSFLTAVDLTPYQLTADMTAYQPAGDYLTTADSANFYTTANTAGYISEVPDTYLQNTDLSTEDGKVTAISGIPLSAGGDVPEGVMVESGLEYNAVNEISGYNGSAIAQYGAEKQFIVHDDTLCHLSNSAQYALGVNVSALQRLMGIDETVLWSGSTKVNTANTITLSEPLTAFNKFRIYDVPFRIGSTPWLQQPITETTLNNVDNGQNYLFGTVHGWVDTWNSTASGSKYRGYCFYSGDSDLTHILCLGSFINSMGSSGKYDMRNEGFIYKIVGIGRKS